MWILGLKGLTKNIVTCKLKSRKIWPFVRVLWIGLLSAGGLILIIASFTTVKVQTFMRSTMFFTFTFHAMKCCWACALRDRSLFSGEVRATMFGGRVNIFLASLWGGPFFEKCL